MKAKVFLSAVLAIMLSVSCGDKASVSVSEGTGQITYDGNNYSVKIATLITGEAGSEGKYSHHISFVSPEPGNYFSFGIENDSSESVIPVGVYQVAENENSASVSINAGTETVTGSRTGTKAAGSPGDSHKSSLTGRSKPAQ